MRSVEPFVNLTIMRTKAWLSRIYFEFYDGYWSSTNKSDIRNIVLWSKNLLQILQCCQQSKMLWEMLKVSKNWIFHSQIYITISNSNTTGTTSKELDLNRVITEQELDSFESYNPSIMVYVSLLRNFVSKTL